MNNDNDFDGDNNSGDDNSFTLLARIAVNNRKYGIKMRCSILVTSSFLVVFLVFFNELYLEKNARKTKSNQEKKKF